MNMSPEPLRFNCSCMEIQYLLSSYLDGELDEGERQTVESHLSSCPSCRHGLESLRNTVNLLHSMPEVQSEKSFAIGKAGERRASRRLKLLISATAFAAILLLTVFIGDVSHYFDAPPLPAPPWPQPPFMGRYYWPVREAEFILLGITIMLALLTVYFRCRKTGGGERGEQQ